MPTRARFFNLTAILLLAACDGDRREVDPVASSATKQAPTEGETRLEVAPKGGGKVSLRTGPKVQVALPEGFTVYPGAVIESNTLVDRAKSRRMLLEFATSDGPDKVVAFYRDQSDAAAMETNLDLTGSEGGGLGGTLPDGRKLSIAVRPKSEGSYVVIAIE